MNPAREQLAALETQRKQVDAGVLRTLVAMAGEPRMTRVLRRGNWLDESGEVVQPAVPGFLKPLPIEGRRATRLDLAQWMASRDNPLVARVLVNRLWKLAFGAAWPRRWTIWERKAPGPCIWNWLIGWRAELIDSGWDVKHMLAVDRHVARVPALVARRGRTRCKGILTTCWSHGRGGFASMPSWCGTKPWSISGLLGPETRRPQRKALSAARLLGRI